MPSSLTLPTFKGSLVQVSILHGGYLHGSTRFFTETLIPGHDSWVAPAHSFLIENKSQGKKVLFDLGVMKAWKEKQPPAILDQINGAGGVIEVSLDVVDQLRDAGVSLNSISSIIWSHHHMDHTGDPSLFPKTTSLVVGPTFKSNPQTYPGYPLNPDALVCQDAFEGRELLELDFSDANLEIGGFKAIDFFGDGSFYLLQAQGHTHDHICALARTSEDKFIFLGGDAAHHNGMFRPTSLLPLPDSIVPSPFPDIHSICPGALFERVHPASARGEDYRTTPFYAVAPHMSVSLEDTKATLYKMYAFDASPDVLVSVAHDTTAQDILPFFPASLNGWETKGYKDLNTWKFLGEFGEALKLAQL